MGQVTIPQYFNLPYGVVVFAVVLMAIGGFAGAGWVEKWMAAAAGSGGSCQRIGQSHAAS